MIRFNNDYNHGAHPAILKAIADTNDTSYGGYGEDEWCDKASFIIRNIIDRPDADVRFFPGATQANFIVIDAALSPVQSVIAADTGHINCHEAASIENTGHKILALPNTDGRITAAQIEACAAAYYEADEPEYLTEPKMVYISFPTESGTLYSKQELTDIYAVCKAHDMPLFIDGARLGYGLQSPACDVTLPELANLCDVFYIGGTKCGALFGEAVVILKESLKKDFRYMIKQRGGMFAKGRLLGIQFDTLFTDGLYEAICGEAVKKAMILREAFLAKGISMYGSSMTNQQFPILTDAQKEALAKDFAFEYWGEAKDGKSIVRFCTSWATNDAQIKALTDAIAAL
jgi:threonine aldolase